MSRPQDSSRCVVTTSPNGSITPRGSGWSLALGAGGIELPNMAPEGESSDPLDSASRLRKNCVANMLQVLFGELPSDDPDVIATKIRAQLELLPPTEAARIIHSAALQPSSLVRKICIALCKEEPTLTVLVTELCGQQFQTRKTNPQDYTINCIEFCLELYASGLLWEKEVMAMVKTLAHDIRQNGHAMKDIKSGSPPYHAIGCMARLIAAASTTLPPQNQLIGKIHRLLESTLGAQLVQHLRLAAASPSPMAVAVAAAVVVAVRAAAELQRRGAPRACATTPWGPPARPDGHPSAELDSQALALPPKADGTAGLEEHLWTRWRWSKGAARGLKLNGESAAASLPVDLEMKGITHAPNGVEEDMQTRVHLEEDAHQELSLEVDVHRQMRWLPLGVPSLTMSDMPAEGFAPAVKDGRPPGFCPRSAVAKESALGRLRREDALAKAPPRPPGPWGLSAGRNGDGAPLLVGPATTPGASWQGQMQQQLTWLRHTLDGMQFAGEQPHPLGLQLQYTLEPWLGPTPQQGNGDRSAKEADGLALPAALKLAVGAAKPNGIGYGPSAVKGKNGHNGLYADGAAPKHLNGDSHPLAEGPEHKPHSPKNGLKEPLDPARDGAASLVIPPDFEMQGIPSPFTSNCCPAPKLNGAHSLASEKWPPAPKLNGHLTKKTGYYVDPGHPQPLQWPSRSAPEDEEPHLLKDLKMQGILHHTNGVCKDLRPEAGGVKALHDHLRWHQAGKDSDEEKCVSLPDVPCAQDAICPSNHHSSPCPWPAVHQEPHFPSDDKALDGLMLEGDGLFLQGGGCQALHHHLHLPLEACEVLKLNGHGHNAAPGHPLPPPSPGCVSPPAMEAGEQAFHASSWGMRPRPPHSALLRPAQDSEKEVGAEERLRRELQCSQEMVEDLMRENVEMRQMILESEQKEKRWRAEKSRLHKEVTFQRDSISTLRDANAHLTTEVAELRILGDHLLAQMKHKMKNGVVPKRMGAS